MTSDTTLDDLRAAIVNVFPEHETSRFSLLPPGWHSEAVDVDDRFVFKFPRHEEAERALEKEARVLSLVRPAVTMPVPDLTVIAGPPMFSRHEKLKGDHLVTTQYAVLPEAARQRLAADIALFYAELHALEAASMAAAGAEPIEPWLRPEDILRRVWPALPEELRSFADRTIAEWKDMPPDPHGTTYGFFDGHGWNMAFDHEAGRLNGIYDFADSGFGLLHQEFIYTNFIDRDLTARIIDEYERLTGRALDRRRVEVLSGVLRLSELAAYADDPEHAPGMIKFVEEWAAG
ncbi:aminoglycoside phosphotransferase family protein [Aquamicrobium sp. LC103]|uniref:phosphotransferase family protein n=1 Tax=Aquamicrobium sp. LC103 TaxID=1120658 RepID=UPI00063ED068|nr:aminoglycoside phosphotransferase family protein [Aquamicrobium sp. LC103]TKT74975.1 aminoglycoside phosphotransferase family protein [Aquamicrobium sp. LC103]